MSLKLMCCHGVCLAVKLPCCFSNPIQAKKNGEEIKTNAELRHSISCCRVLSLALHPPPPERLYNLLPSMGWVKQPPWYLPPKANVLLSHVMGAWESTCHSF